MRWPNWMSASPARIRLCCARSACRCGRRGRPSWIRAEDFERVHVARTIEELVTRSEIIQDALAHDRLMIVGARYQLSTGKVEVLSF